ncbi:ribosome small subunit-dependent GTPase A [Luteimonas sp. MC1828]|uniref:ribosome small subunit-dependent GTPase A n=1 Tax=Luteimonas sp. MC1828 TaxID=2799787 RepID=UPI001F47127B|nr:ribosome small subunit-dependent GTPase A [Luteimonas sp. MC1828]
MSPEILALRAIGWPYEGLPATGGWAALMAAHPAAQPVRVVEQHRTKYVVAVGPGEGFGVESLPEWQRPKCPPEQRAAVGDWLLVEGRQVVALLLPRRSVVKRAAAGEHYKQQIIATNIDTAFVVCGLDGDFNPRRIERYLLLVQGGGVEPVLVLTKADQPGVDVDGALAELEDSIRAGLAVVVVNARDPASVAALAPWLGPGRTVVLVGSSGAGKSTLTNSLVGHERMRTGAVRENDARGRHTTTHRALVPLASGACLIDTPGMRELKPTGEEDIAEGGFAEVEALAGACRFRDCKHDREPGCAVRAAIDAGTVDRARFAHYLKLRDEVAGAASVLASRLAQAQAKPGRR